MKLTKISKTGYIFALALSVMLVGPTSAHAQAKKRIAILPFDDHLAGTANLSIGEKVADGLISKLADSGVYEIVDRQYLDNVMREQNLKLGERFDAAGAAKIGKLANVDVLIIGQVNAFHADAATETANGMFSNKTSVNGEIELKVTARMISVETASILAAPTASSEMKKVLSQKTDIMPSVDGRNSFSSKSSGTGNVNTALLKLLDKSVDDVSADLGKQIDGSVAKIPATSARAATAVGKPAKVVGMQGELALINRGTAAGIKVGSQFAVVRPVDSGMKDPDTGQPVIRNKKICNITITEVDDAVSAGKVDGEKPLAGDEAKPAQN